jgi:hypothetical protein
LRFMLIYSPRWLFLVPGLLLAVLGTLCSAILALTPVRIGAVQLDTGTLAVSSMGVLIGTQLVAFAFFTKVFAIAEGLLPQDPKFSRMFQFFTLERGICLGLLILGLGAALFFYALWVWEQAGYGMLPYSANMRRLIPAVSLLAVGVEVIFSSFFMSVLGLKTTSRRPPGA